MSLVQATRLRRDIQEVEHEILRLLDELKYLEAVKVEGTV